MPKPEGTLLSHEARSLLAYWRKCRGDAALPGREHISPAKLRRWIGDISVLHLHEGEKRFYVALHGENVVHHIGPGFNRQYLEDVVPEASLSLSLAPYLVSIEKRVPVYLTMEPDLSNGLLSRLTRLVFPFSDTDPDRVGRFLVYVQADGAKSEKDSMIYSSTCGAHLSHATPSPFAIYDDFKGDEIIPAGVTESHPDPTMFTELVPHTAPRRRKRFWGGFLGALERG